MLKKQIYVGQVSETKIYIHISLILSTILAWSLITLIVKPALGFNYGPLVYGPIAFMSAVVMLMVKVGYEIGRLVLLQNHDMKIENLLLLPLSGLFIYEEEPPRRSMGFWSSMIPALPLIGVAAMFSALTLSPTASEFQTIIMRGIALVIIFFTAARLLGAFAVDRLNTAYSLVWRFTGNSRAADFVYEIWRNFSIASILILAVAVSPTYRWLGIALAISIAWGLYDAIFYQRISERRIASKKASAYYAQAARSSRMQEFAGERMLN